MSDIKLNSKKLIKNYASALFESTTSCKMQEEILEQIIAIDQVINNDTQIRAFMCSPIIKNIDKMRIVGLITQNFKIQAIAQQFLHLLVKNGRISILSSVVSYYRQFLNDSKNIKMVELISSRALSGDEKEWFQGYLENQLKQKILINFSYDRSIIGGTIIQYDSMLIDCSIAGALRKIERIAKNVRIFNR